MNSVCQSFEFFFIFQFLILIKDQQKSKWPKNIKMMEIQTINLQNTEKRLIFTQKQSVGVIIYLFKIIFLLSMD